MTPERIARSRPVWLLALGQMLGYACLYYVFAALVVAWHDDLGWDQAVLALGPMVAILVSAALAPVMGRLVDRGRAGRLLTLGPLLGAAALVGLSRVGSVPVWIALWAAMGAAQAACLYEVCFSFLIRRLGPAGRAAIIRITLVAGLASTLAFPAGAALAQVLGWRAALLAAAGVMVLVAPLNLWALRAIRRAGPPAGLPGPGGDAGALPRALRAGAFWLLALVFALSALNHWMIVNLAVPVFAAQGAGAGFAVVAAACIGPAQVLGRLAVMAVDRHLTLGRIAALTMGGSVLASLALLAAGAVPALVVGYAVVQGAAIGIMTILRPVMIAEIVGPAGYGTIAGAIQIPALVAGAAAPVLGALVLHRFGAEALALLSLGLLAAALGALRRLARRHGPVTERG